MCVCACVYVFVCMCVKLLTHITTRAMVRAPCVKRASSETQLKHNFSRVQSFFHIIQSCRSRWKYLPVRIAPAGGISLSKDKARMYERHVSTTKHASISLEKNPAFFTNWHVPYVWVIHLLYSTLPKVYCGTFQLHSTLYLQSLLVNLFASFK